MPRLDDLIPQRTATIGTPGGGALTVTVRPSAYTIDREVEVQAAIAAGDSDVTADGLCSLIAAVVAAWDLTDNDGAPWPLDRASLRRLPPQMLMWVMEGIRPLLTPAADAGESSPSAAG